MSRYTASTDRPLSGAPDRIDITGTNESCLRVDGGAAGSAVTNLGPCAAQYAAAVTPDELYADQGVLEVGDTHDIAIGDVVDFWASGAGRSMLVVSHPDPAPIAQSTPEPLQATDVPADPAPDPAEPSDDDVPAEPAPAADPAEDHDVAPAEADPAESPTEPPVEPAQSVEPSASGEAASADADAGDGSST